MSNVEEKIQIIVHTLKNYKKDIKELKEKLTSTIPLEVLAEREQQESLQV
jgi:FtsZ-binding cell division protein ZapB